MDREKIFGDAVFGFITIKPYIFTIIDTPEFQRLRKIWQLGLTPFVYPTADHSRFEHSIGTYSLASKIITNIQKQLAEENAEIQISDKDIKCIEIAALCHDIGHGPFSHFWDIQVLPNICPSAPKHESQFKEIWDTLKRNNPKVREMLRMYQLTEEDENLINAIINGTVIEGKEILFSIVNNATSGLDVDKWDYLARDSFYLGQSSTNYRVDIERMLRFVRAIKDDKDGKWKLAFRDTERLNILRVFQLRDYMHRTAYKHRVTVGLDLMMLDGFKRCVDENILDKDKIGTTDWILQNTDGIFWSHINEIEEFKRILRRELYKQIIEAIKQGGIKNPKEKIGELKKHLTEKGIDTKNIRYGFSSFKLSSTDNNPMCNVPFYKRDNNRELFRYTEENLPSNLKVNADESRFIIFSTSSNIDGNIRTIKNTLAEYFKGEKWEVTELLPSDLEKKAKIENDS